MASFLHSLASKYETTSMYMTREILYALTFVGLSDFFSDCSVGRKGQEQAGEENSLHNLIAYVDWQ